MIEAVLLTGGRSARMGQDKATIEVDGEPQAKRLVRLLREAGIPTTTLGREPILGAAHLEDDATVHGPLDALRRFRPAVEFVFVLSCDLPRFDPKIVELLRNQIGDADAAVPFVDGFRQPLVALFRATAFAKIPNSGCPTDWLDMLDVKLLNVIELASGGIHSDATRGANTPEEWSNLVNAVS